MPKNVFPFTTGSGIGASPLTWEQATAIFSTDEVARGEKRGAMLTSGMWCFIRRYKALACSQDFSAEGPDRYKLTVFGIRSLHGCRETGHDLEGRVSVQGKSRRGFTSSQLFQLPDGRLVDCAIIHVCMNQ